MKNLLFVFLLLAFGYSQCDSTNVFDYYPNMQGCELAGFNFIACTEDNYGYINCGRFSAYQQLLYNADFTNANLEGATFSADTSPNQGWMENTTFTDANLKDTNLSGAYINNVDFTGANLESSDFTNAQINNSTFNGVNMKDAVLEELLVFNTCSFIGANLEESRISFNGWENSNLNFTEANFSGAYIGRDTYFSMGNVSGGNFTDANFTGAHISNIDFYANCTLYQANFHGAYLSTLSFNGTVYKGNFSDANLYDVRFGYDSDITEANFQNANIDCAGYSLLYECDAAGVNFESATFGTCDISESNINNAIFSNVIFEGTLSISSSDIQDTCFDEAAESQISFYSNTGTPNFGICEFEYDDGCAYDDENGDGYDDVSFVAGQSSVDITSDNQAAYDSGFVDGAGSITPEDGIGQSDVDTAYESGYVDGAASVDITTDNDVAYGEGYAIGYDIGALSGDSNGDGVLNVLDLVYFVEIIVNGE